LVWGWFCGRWWISAAGRRTSAVDAGALIAEQHSIEPKRRSKMSAPFEFPEEKHGFRELEQVCDQLRRLHTHNYEPCLVIFTNRMCYLVNNDEVCIDTDRLSDECNIECVINELKHLPAEPEVTAEDLRSEIQYLVEHDLNSLTPEYLREMAKKIEDLEKD
jgi:hypothetical protein